MAGGYACFAIALFTVDAGSDCLLIYFCEAADGAAGASCAGVEIMVGLEGLRL